MTKEYFDEYYDIDILSIEREFNPGYILAKLDNKIINKLWKEINEIQNNFENSVASNKILAGHIKKEYFLYKNKEDVLNIVGSLIDVYNKNFNYATDILMNYFVDVDPEKLPLKIDTMWVNFQKKYEFNPIHKHSGCFSFVIWMKIPYSIENELSVFDANQSQTSCFNFHYNNSLGNIQTKTLYIDSSYENVLCLFPSGLNHSVNPFYTSDDYRITISGNISISTKQ